MDDLDALFEAAKAEAQAARASTTAGSPGASSTRPATAPGPAAPSTATAALPAAPAVDSELAGDDRGAGLPRRCGCGEVQDLRRRLGQLTRDLHESLKALQLDETLAQVAAEIPDARSRLKYVTEMCERSAQRVLDSLDALEPIQSGLRVDADALFARWDRMITHRERPEGGYARLFADTHAYLGSVPARTRQVGELHTEILMAQDFQDLTGQVCRKIEAITQRIETQLLALLVDTAPGTAPGREGEPLEGPQVVGGRDDTVGSQGEVDELLASLGF